MTLVWEKVDSQFVNSEHLNGYETLDPVLLYRARVPGGWFVVRRLPSHSAVINFYPDPAHAWQGWPATCPGDARREYASLR